MGNVLCLNKQWHTIGNNEKFWQRKIQTDFPNIPKNQHSISHKLLHHNLLNSGTVYYGLIPDFDDRLVTIHQHAINFQGANIDGCGYIYVLDVFGCLYKIPSDPKSPDFETDKNKKLILTNIKQFCANRGALYYLTLDGEFYEHNTGKKYADQIKHINCCGNGTLGYVNKNNELYCQLNIRGGFNGEGEFFMIGQGIKKFTFLDYATLFCVTEEGSLIKLFITLTISDVLNGINFKPHVESHTIISRGIESILEIKGGVVAVENIKNEIMALIGFCTAKTNYSCAKLQLYGPWSDAINGNYGSIYSSIHDKCGDVRVIRCEY